MACRIMICSCSLCPYCGTSDCPEFNEHIERYWVYATDKKHMYLTPKVKADDLKSLRAGIKNLCREKGWAKRHIYNQRVELTITDGQHSWSNSIRIYLSIEDGVLYTEDNKVWDWKLTFVER